MRLYDFELSGNCYKVRLLLGMLGLDYQRVPVDSSQGETLTPAFKTLNPRGQIPVLEDGELRLWDSLAILVYLARRYGDPERAGGPWLPVDAVGEARVMQWLALSENELLYGLARARSVLHFGRPFNLAACQAEGRAGLKVLEGHLQDRNWLVSEVATIADVACYPYVALADEAGVALGPYPAVRRWLERFAALPGYHTMPGVAAG
ncbi:MAG: glutathione S-transferase family protein [Bdellovibrio bacteriovorus]